MAYLYKEISEKIKEDISNGVFKVGTRIPGELQLMDLFHVSRQTIRNAISDLIDQGLLEATQGKGTFVTSKAITLERRYLAGFGTISFTNYQLFPHILQETNNSLKNAGYSMVLGESENTVDTERTMLLDFLEKGVDVLALDPVFCGLPNMNADIYKMYMDRGRPIIEYSAHRENSGVSYVVADDVMGGYIAAKHLLELGHTKIGALFQADDIRGRDRYMGLCKALREFGIPIDNRIIDWYSGVRIDAQVKSINQAPNKDTILERILKSCTAVIAYNDVVTAYVMKVMNQLNLKCPEDISIVSFDDTDFIDEVELGLTTVPFPAREIGLELGKVTLQLLEDPTKIIEKKIPVQLVVRNSTRKI